MSRYSLFTLENLPYTDCLLRHIGSHRYVGVWDLDEFMLPALPHTSLTDMVDTAKLRWFTSTSSHCHQQFQHQYELISREHPILANIDFRQEQVDREDPNKSIYNDIRIIKFIDSMDHSKLERRCRPPVSYIGQCTYFFDDLVEPTVNATLKLHMLHHVTRTMKFLPPPVYSKVR